MNIISTMGSTLSAKNLVAPCAVKSFLNFSPDLECSIKTRLFWSGRCSIRTRRMRIRKWRNKPKIIQISINLIVAVCGSLEAMEWLRVYITSIAVIATGILVLKCSLLKNSVAWNESKIHFQESNSKDKNQMATIKYFSK